ncbi:OmpA family protein [Polynucleobacter sp. 30F-ANTBAC]|jgi:chemotaxis protein MotB|uniref:flagellar motor protein MotB n=1 Tax=Polynucleobacter sp. 30F-ANTBAC TaxID=2689095 RepID=UPI001C0BEA8B|nr:flagellar motor protein MotB [Polynucleobacter sp. 30F-ANTBAC]MBU3599747.1 OmpA family protein [Polynucleobacter sp. 30F-ANTBAC]
MAFNNSNATLVIRRPRKRVKKSFHGGAWKLAYGDFVTAMMAFFMIMWIINMLPQKQREGVADYFKEPLRGTVTKGENQLNEIGANPELKGQGDSKSIKDGKEDKPDEGMSKGQSTMSEANSAKADMQRMAELKKEIERLIAENAGLINANNQMFVEETVEGLKIILSETKKPMFNIGSNSMEESTRAVLRKLAPALSASKFQIKVEGHTDNLQYKTGSAYTNWELSTERANSARRELMAGGLGAEKIAQVSGYADTVHLIPGEPNNPLNRRISITAFSHMNTKFKDEGKPIASPTPAVRTTPPAGNAAPVGTPRNPAVVLPGPKP